MADLGLAKVLETQNHGQVTPTTSEDDLDDKADDSGHKNIYPDWSGPRGTPAWMAPEMLGKITNLDKAKHCRIRKTANTTGRSINSKEISFINIILLI